MTWNEIGDLIMGLLITAGFIILIHLLIYSTDKARFSEGDIRNEQHCNTIQCPNVQYDNGFNIDNSGINLYHNQRN